MKIQVKYTSDIPIGAIGPSVWAKLGPEAWFDRYVIVAANRRDYQADFVKDLGIQLDDLERFTTQNIIETPAFSDVALGEMKDFRFLVYRPVEPVPGIGAERFIANDLSYSRFEDKKYFRDVFGSMLPIARFEISPMESLLQGKAGDFFERFSEALGLPFVLQDNITGGGRGTFIIKDIADLEYAKVTLADEHKGDFLVLSKFIRGIERSIQVFVSENDTRPGPLQQQLVRNSELLNPEGRGGMFFCGGRFLENVSARIDQQVQEITRQTAQYLREQGYRGIYGIDFIVDENDTVYVMEINARTTGLLPLLNEQSVEVPLYLLHILELAGENYEILSNEAKQKVNGPSSFVVLFNQTDQRAWFDRTITTGNYRYQNGELTKIDDVARWHPDADVMIQLFAAPEFPAKPNLKLANIFLKDSGFDDNGTLTQQSRDVVERLKQHITKG